MTQTPLTSLHHYYKEQQQVFSSDNIMIENQHSLPKQNFDGNQTSPTSQQHYTMNKTPSLSSNIYAVQNTESSTESPKELMTPELGESSVLSGKSRKIIEPE